MYITVTCDICFIFVSDREKHSIIPTFAHGRRPRSKRTKKTENPPQSAYVSEEYAASLSVIAVIIGRVFLDRTGSSRSPGVRPNTFRLARKSSAASAAVSIPVPPPPSVGRTSGFWTRFRGRPLSTKSPSVARASRLPDISSARIGSTYRSTVRFARFTRLCGFGCSGYLPNRSDFGDASSSSAHSKSST